LDQSALWAETTDQKPHADIRTSPGPFKVRRSAASVLPTSNMPWRQVMRKRLRFAFLLLLMFAPSLFAQETPKVDIFAGYSYLNVDTNGLLSPSRQSANGWEASVSGNVYKSLAIEGDFSGYYKTYDLTALGLGNANVHAFGFLGGPRVNVGPVFVHALIGGDRATGSDFGLSASQNSFAAAFGGGVQISAAPRWAIRASADYVLTRHNIFKLLDPTLPNYTQNNFRISAGIVFRFGSGTGRTTRPPTNATEQVALLGITGYGTSQGFYIISVASGSPAQTAGMNPDNVLTKIDGRPVHTSMDIENAIAANATGTIRLTYMIAGAWFAERDVKVH
jgi:Outer membrane protein beta-barrel domain/PDZ domain